MTSESKSPFAAASSNGNSPSPFQSASSATDVTPSTSLPDAKPETKVTPEKPSSPFALVDEGAKSNGKKQGKLSIVEPSEGFAASEATPKQGQKPASTTPVAMPSGSNDKAANTSNGSNANRNDPFADPSSSAAASGAASRSNFVLPAEGEKPAAVQASQAPVAARSQPAAAQPAAVATGDTSQLVLRAIFGVSRDLNRDEIIQRARTLPGIRNLQLVSPADVGAFAAFRNSIQRMGFGDQSTMAITTNGGVVDFVEETGASLAVLHEGTYAAGVRETLILVAREIARLV